MKNNKGFTLIELIVTIAIVALVMGLTTFGIFSIVDASKDEKKAISQNSIIVAANTYATDFDKGWKKPYGIPYDAFCVTVGELVNKGLLDRNVDDASQKAMNDFVIVKRDKMTLAISEKKFAESGSEEEDICLGNIKESKVKNVAPQITNIDPYTDQVTVTFKKGKAYDENNTAIVIEDKGHRCVYCDDGGTSCYATDDERSVIATDSSSDEMTCTIKNLKDSTIYRIIARFDYTVDGEENRIARLPSEEATLTLIEPVIKQDGKTVQITYDDTGIKEGQAKHYFKSEKSGTVNKEVYACKSVSNGIGDECIIKTKTLEAGKWYELRNATDVTITYGDIETAKVNAEISDGTNFKDKDFVFKLKKVTVKFYKNYASSIGGSTSEYKEVSCYAEEGKSCNITAPSITAPDNYKVVGYSTSSSGTSSTWEVGTSKAISTNQNYYAIVSRTLTVKFYRNGVYMLDNSTSTYVSKECTLYNGDTYCMVTSPTIKVNDGSKIIGFNSSSNGTYSECDSNSSCFVSKDTNYYAVVEKFKTVTITFMRNTATSINYSYVNSIKETCTISAGQNDCTVITPSIQTSAGRVAVGWSLNSNGIVATIKMSQEISVNSDETYYAITRQVITPPPINPGDGGSSDEKVEGERYVCLSKTESPSNDFSRMIKYYVSTCNASGDCTITRQYDTDVGNYPNNRDIFKGVKVGMTVKKSKFQSLDSCTYQESFTDKGSAAYCYSRPDESSSKVRVYLECSYIRAYVTTLKTSGGSNFYYVSDSEGSCYLDGEHYNNNGSGEKCTDSGYSKNPPSKGSSGGGGGGGGAHCDHTVPDLCCCAGNYTCFCQLH